MGLFGKIKTLVSQEDKAATQQPTESVEEFSPEALDKPPNYTFVEALPAARKGNLSKIQDYLNFNKKYARCKNWDDCMLLHEAARFSRPEVVKLLLEKGASVDALYKDKTPLHFAIEGDASETANKNTQKYQEYRKRRFETIKILLHHRADLEAANGVGELPLHFAARLGYSEIVNLLLAGGADVHSQIQPIQPRATNIGRTSLLLAAKYNKDKKTLQLLLEKGADPNQLDNDPGYAPLHYITAYHSNQPTLTEKDLKELATLLIEHHADVNGYTTDKQAPLHLAIIHHHVGLVDLLLNNGADINLQNKDGFSAMALSARNGDAEMVDYFLNKGADIYKSRVLYHAAACPHCDAALKLLIDKGADINQPDPKGYTPLFAAISAYSLTNVKLLIDSGADTNIQPPRLSLKEHAFACWGEVVNLRAEEEVSEERQQKATNAKEILVLLGAFKDDKKKLYI